MKKFSEIAKDDIHLAGEKISLQDIVGKTIVITGYKITKSKFNLGSVEAQREVPFPGGIRRQAGDESEASHHNKNNFLY